MERPSKRARSASRSGHDRSQSVGPNGRSLSRPSRLEQALPTAEVCWYCYWMCFRWNFISHTCFLIRITNRRERKSLACPAWHSVLPTSLAVLVRNRDEGSSNNIYICVCVRVCACGCVCLNATFMCNFDWSLSRLQARRTAMCPQSYRSICSAESARPARPSADRHVVTNWALSLCLYLLFSFTFWLPGSSLCALQFLCACSCI